MACAAAAAPARFARRYDKTAETMELNDER